MGLFQLDMVIKTMLELGIEDMRKESWLIDHMLSDCTTNTYLKNKYGQSHIDACKEWFLNNKIDIYLRPRTDKDSLPCITITPGPAPEKDEMKTMGDASTESVILMPQQIGKPIPYVVKPFTPTGYEIGSGLVSIPDVKGSELVSPGMILVDPSSGRGYEILDIDAEGFYIEAGTDLDSTQFAVVPKNQFYTARVEHTWTTESCEIGCWGHGDPQTVLWLHSIVLYTIFRYRESLLEANGFAQSSIASSQLAENPYYEGPNGEQGFVRSIQLSGIAEQTWVKTPRRTIESIVLREKEGDGYVGGIKVMSNLDVSEDTDKSQELWYTIKSEN